jgi:signal transduction histidine kinase
MRRSDDAGPPAFRVYGDQTVVRFSVKDTGIGMPFQGQRHLFQAFAQEHK